MNLEERIESFAKLGRTLKEVLNGGLGSYGEQLISLINNQQSHNPWFTPENVKMAITAIANELTEDNLIKWTNAYPELKSKKDPVRAGLIMAGNIPLVGFHDFLSVLISGNNVIAKTSSKDPELIILISEMLCAINKKFRGKIAFTEGTLTNFDIVIATGSNNSSRYFEYYFSKYPNIIRKNRNSIAIIDGNETSAEVENLGTDIFSYFGLGCRNISKIFIPKEYDISKLITRWFSFSDIINNIKYANNYDFNKAVYLVNKESFHDTGYLLIKEDSRISSPVSVLFYEVYESQSVLKHQLELNKDNIQCIAGRQYLPFGQTQSPRMWEYADGIDTIEFLLKNNCRNL